jgi:regulator of protease activity HflC (stomatin/prohibitin superfamily)
VGLEKFFEILQAIWHSLLPFVVITHYQEAVLLRLGIYKRNLGPGFHWIIPLNFDSVLHDDVKPRTERLTGLSTTTADGKSIGFDAVITYFIADIKKALLEVHDLQDAVADTCAGVIGTELSNAEWRQIWHGEVTENLTAVCRKRGRKWGIEVQAVQLMGVALVKNLRISGNSSNAKAFHFNMPTA